MFGPGSFLRQGAQSTLYMINGHIYIFLLEPDAYVYIPALHDLSRGYSTLRRRFPNGFIAAEIPGLRVARTDADHGRGGVISSMQVGSRKGGHANHT